MNQKNVWKLLIAAFMLSASCNNGDDSKNDMENNTDTMTSANTGNTDGRTTAGGDSSVGTYSYMDLNTNQAVTPSRDTATSTYIDLKTMKPLTFYYDPNSHDTFDSRGRNVNNALLNNHRGYSVDTTKVKSEEDAIALRNQQKDSAQ